MAARDNATGARRAPSPSRSEAFARYEKTLTAIMVGGAVRTARHRVGISQAELAVRAGTSQPSIARLEQGRVSPTVISLERIARALDTELVIDFEPLAAPDRSGGSERRSDRRVRRTSSSRGQRPSRTKARDATRS